MLSTLKPQSAPASDLRFQAQDRTGDFSFSAADGRIHVEVCSTSTNPDDFAPLDYAVVSVSPEEADAIGRFWIMWADHARAQRASERAN